MRCFLGCLLRERRSMYNVLVIVICFIHVARFKADKDVRDFGPATIHISCCNGRICERLLMAEAFTAFAGGLTDDNHHGRGMLDERDVGLCQADLGHIWHVSQALMELT